ncbi:YceI family protein [Flagellimonas sp. DF-77]|uniref:YceI family protein n=1 Tax=Flagellimonas algarum TaxID=3230298 RepID=UPI00339A6BE6
MNRPTLILLLLFPMTLVFGQDRLVARQGQVSFFSYTSVENIEATNNQVFSIIDLDKNEIAISMLMRAFVFKKALMQEHFNESYIESDIHPKATFEGRILEFDPKLPDTQTKLVKGMISLHGVTKEKEIKTTIERVGQGLLLTGSFTMTVADYQIKIPPIVAGNIAKTIEVTFRIQFASYEK